MTLHFHSTRFANDLADQVVELVFCQGSYVHVAPVGVASVGGMESIANAVEDAGRISSNVIYHLANYSLWMTSEKGPDECADYVWSATQDIERGGRFQQRWTTIWKVGWKFDESNRPFVSWVGFLESGSGLAPHGRC